MKIDLVSYENTHLLHGESFVDVAAKALSDYGQIDPKFHESDLSGIHKDAARMIMWIYANKDNTFTVELEEAEPDEEHEDYVKTFEGTDVNALITEGLAFFKTTIGRTRVYPATIEEYRDCGMLGSMTFFCDTIRYA